MTTSFRKKLFTAFILIVLCFVSAYFLATPFWKKYSASKTELMLADQKVENLNLSLGSIDTFLNSYEDLGPETIVTGLALPANNPDIEGLVSSLSALAAASGVALADMHLEEPATEKTSPPHTIQELEINLSATGTYLAFEDFILRLENHLRIFDIRKITLTTDEGGVLKYQMSLMTYYQK